MSISCEEFLQNLENANLLEMTELREWLDALPAKEQPADGTALAKLLVAENKLTPYQAQVVFRGKGSNLTLGNYVIQEKLGQGGMGMVFRAQHRKMKREVALKVVSAKLANNPDTMNRFQREVEAAAKLHHPNIVVAFDADDYEGTFFLVMEVVEGKDLSSIVKKKGPVKIPQAVDLIVQSARGLQYAHEQGVIHRDIKPSNLLLDKSGTVKILDMGLARIEAETEQTELTNTGAVMGTIDYMAPEQAVSTKHVDARSDIYSLGCSLWYLLTARSTYEGETAMGKLLAHRDHPIPSLLEARDDATPELQGIFEKMVAKRVEDRYASMKEVIADLEKFQSGDPSLSGILKKTSVEESAEGNLQNFLAGLNDDETSPAATRVNKEPKTKQRRVGDADATRVAGTEDLGTDPNSFTLPANATGKTRAIAASQKTWWQNRKIQVAIGGGVALLIVLAVMFSGGGGDVSAPSVPPPGSNQTAAATPGVPENDPAKPSEKEIAATTAGTSSENANGETKTVDPVQSFLPDLGKGEPTKPGANMSQTASAGTAKKIEPTEGEWIDLFTTVKNPSIDPPDSWKPVPGGFRCDSQEGDPPSLELPLDLPDKFQLRWEMKHGGYNAFRGWRALEFPIGNHAMSFAFDTADEDVVGTGIHQSVKYRHVINNPKAYKQFLKAEDEFKKFVLTVTYDDPNVSLQLSMDGETIYESTGPLEEWKRNQGGVPGGLRFLSIPDLFWEIRNLQLRDLSEEPQSLVANPSPAKPAATKPPAPAVAKPPEPSPHALKVELKGKPPRPEKWPFTPKDAQKSQERWAKHLSLETEYKNSLGMKFKLIPPGEFQMGVSKQQLDFLLRNFETGEALQPAHPQQSITLSTPFYLATTEVTQQHYQDVMNENPSEHFPGRFRAGAIGGKDNMKLPVDSVSWLKAVEFCNRLSEREELVPCYNKVGDSYQIQQDGTGYRLPAEAEWEFACRAGSSSYFWFGDPPPNATVTDKGKLRKLQNYYADWVAQFETNSHSLANKTLNYPATRMANPFGLYDMHGSFRELCHNWMIDYSESTDWNQDLFGPDKGTGRVVKGGTFHEGSHNMPNLTSAARIALSEERGHPEVSFRVLRVIPLPQVETTPETTPAKPAVAETSKWELKPELKGREPKLEKWPFSPTAAQKSQERWARHLSLETDYENSLGMKFKLIPPGEFQMGLAPDRLNYLELSHDSDTTEFARYSAPQQKVKLTKPYYLGTTEVTQNQFLEIMDENPSMTQPGGSYAALLLNRDHLLFPVEALNWSQAVLYCNRLSEKEGLSPCYQIDEEEVKYLPGGTGYRLPSSAEWEFAALAGSNSFFWFGDPPNLGSTSDKTERHRLYQNWMAKFEWIGKQPNGTNPVGTSSPLHPFGLYDVHGNVKEWCWDWYHIYQPQEKSLIDPIGPDSGDARVARGGQFSQGGYQLPLIVGSSRSPLAPELNNINNHSVGLRVVRVIPFEPAEETK